MELIDIGCNLTHDSFAVDRAEVIQRARAAGVVQMIVTGASEEGSSAALELAHAYPGELFATCGVHPHHAVDFTVDSEALMNELCGQPGMVAIGETGLDYYRDFSPRNAQRKAFERQLQIAINCGLPLFLHQRDAHEDFIAIVREVRDQLSNLVVHCFTGTRQELFQCLDLDCFIGITGWICDERRGTHMQEFMQNIPAQRLMIETDSPYLKPRNLKPKVKAHRNEPQWLPWIAQTLAACRGETVEQLAAQTTANARRFFRLEKE